jgi:hypothetical protein
MITMARSRPLDERRHAMLVGTGLYLLRYVSAPSSENHPVVTVNQHPHNANITLMSEPGGSDMHLEAPGDCIVVRARVPGALSLVISADDPDTPLDAELRLERIVSSAQNAAELPRANPSMECAPASQDDVSILAHVSRRGDVVAQPGEWICGPDLPLPIEGLTVQWPDRPAGVELNYTVVSSRANQMRKLAATVGKFAGTRGKAAPLVAVDLTLAGSAASAYELRAEALFLGAAIVSQSGRRLSFTGPSGREPLVGFRLEIAERRGHAARKAESLKTPKRRYPRKVKVYRPAPAAERSMTTTQNQNV